MTGSPALEELESALQEHALALVGPDPSVLERANVRLAAAVEEIRRAGKLDERLARSLKQRLSTQAELLARARVNNQMALKSLELPVSGYPNASVDVSPARRRTHVIV